MNASDLPPDLAFPLGIVEGMSSERYHAMPGISCTGLKTLARSPWHYYSRYRNPKRPPARSRSGHLEGQLAHCAVLEPHEFEKRYVAAPANAPRRPSDSQWNAKKPSAESIKAMDWWLDFRQRNGGKQEISSEQYDVAMGQAESIRRLPEARELLDACTTEVSAFWIDPETGVQCRCRPDLVHPTGGGVVLADLKTFSDASPREFAREIVRKLYHVQDGYYSEGWTASTGLDVQAFVFIAVEDEYPFAACLHMLDDASREKGRARARTLLNRYAECLKSDVWPGYSDGIELITLSNWA